MKRRRISSALAGIAFSAAVCAALWPHAREAGAVVLAQDDPAELSDVRIDAVLQKNQSQKNQSDVAEQIEAALAAGDADLANSFVSLATEKNVPVTDELSRQVAGAVAEENSSAHFAKRFATGLVTGVADDAASLSGTVTGDLFWCLGLRLRAWR